MSKKFLLITIILLALFSIGCSGESSWNTDGDSLDYDLEIVELLGSDRLLMDKDTKVLYYHIDYGNSASAITVLLNADGTPKTIDDLGKGIE